MKRSTKRKRRGMTYLEIKRELKRELLEKARALIEQNAHRYICIALIRIALEMRSNHNHNLGPVYKSLVYEAWWHYDREVHETLGGQDVEDYLEANKIDVDPKQFRLELLSKMIDELEGVY